MTYTVVFPIGVKVRLNKNAPAYDRNKIGSLVGMVLENDVYPFVDWDGLTTGHDATFMDGRMSVWDVYQGFLELVESE